MNVFRLGCVALRRGALGLVAAVAVAWPAAAQTVRALDGDKQLLAILGDETRLPLGSVRFQPAAGGAVAFTLTLDSKPFSDHFLSMREFKCLAGRTELSCHVPYPYANPRVVTPGDLTWLEHSLLFFYKLPADFGAKLWNGVYFEFRLTDKGLVGTPKAIDLNRIAAPPADPSVPPFRRALRDDMPPQARWIRSLVIE